MLAGIIFLVAAILFGGVGLFLPRLTKKLNESLRELPQEILPMASSLVPGLGNILRLTKLLTPLALVCLCFGFLFGALGVYAVLAPPIPTALAVFAYLIGALLILLCIGLSVAWKRFSPTMRQMGQMNSFLRK